MKKNYFISINFTRDFSEKIFEKLDKELIERCLIGKFIPLEKYHLTLKFFGNMSNEKVEKVKRDLRKINFKKFDLKVGRLGFFKKDFVGGILWVELVSLELKRLVEEVSKIVGEEKRKFKGHLTIFRVKKILDKKTLFDYIEKERFDQIHFIVDNFSLMKSELLPEGSKYKIIESFFIN